MSGSAPQLVLGAGVCGLYGALTLVRRGIPVLVLEKEPRIGGLAASVMHEGNPHDFGVHMLHGFDAALRDDLLSLMGDKAIPVPLKARIRWRGHDFRYPLEFPDLLGAMPRLELFRGVAGLLGAGLSRRAPGNNAEEALIALYGTSLYRSFFEDFTHRYWGLHPRQLSATFIYRKMPRLTAMDAVRRTLEKLGVNLPAPQVESALREETLYYSARGSSGLTEAIAAEIHRLGGRVLTSAEATSLEFPADRPGLVRYRHRDQSHEAPVRGCLSTIPLKSFVDLLQPSPPAAVLAAAGSLRYRAMAVHGVRVRKPRCMDALYTYYRDRCFHRVSEPGNAGMRVRPEGHTVLLAERMCEPGDPVWQGTPEAISETIDDAVAEGLFMPDELAATHVLRCRHAYPVFELGFERHLQRVLDHIATRPGLHTAGRQGGFSYPNMHSAMKEGALAAETCLAAGS